MDTRTGVTEPSLSRREFDARYQSPVLGIDEVGLGCIAGPIYAAGAVLPEDPELLFALEKMGLKDSKKLAEEVRQRLVDFMEEQHIFYVVGFAPPEEIDQYGPSGSLNRIFKRIHREFQLTVKPKTILLDGPSRPRLKFEHEGIIQGDNKSLAIAAASCIAKVKRDQFMRELGDQEEFREYGWIENKGYPTKPHLRALLRLGPTPHHRKSTKPVRKVMKT